MDWQQQQRQRSIEIILHWQGRLNTGDLMAAFGISRIQASKDISIYRKKYPSNLRYDLSERTYFRGARFKRRLIKGTVDEYLDHVARMPAIGTDEVVVRIAPHYSVQRREIIAQVLNAMISKQRMGIVIQYASMHHPDGVERTIYPHSLIDSGFRWHVRAWCAQREAFRDFNLGRILQPPTKAGNAPECASIAHDTQWNNIIDITLIANPALSSGQQHLLAREFDMEDGALNISSRAALVHYTLQRYQIDPDRLERPPETQLLAVRDAGEVAPFLFHS